MDVKKQAKDTVHNVAEQAKDQLRETVDKFKTDSIDRPKENLSDRMNSVARAIRRTAEELRNDGESTMASPMDRLAESIDSFSESLRNQRPTEIISRVERMGRENPGALFGTFAAVGFLMSRGIRSGIESHREYSEGSGAGSVVGSDAFGSEPYVSGTDVDRTATSGSSSMGGFGPGETGYGTTGMYGEASSETRSAGPVPSNDVGATVTPIRMRSETEPSSDIDRNTPVDSATAGPETQSNLGEGTEPLGPTTPGSESDLGVKSGYGDSSGKPRGSRRTG